MGRAVAALALVLALVLSGCSWMDGSYVSVTPHQVAVGQNDSGNARAVRSYTELRSALVRLIDEGSTKGLFSLSDYPREEAEADMAEAVKYVMTVYPVGAYAVQDIQYGFGSGAVSVDITYSRSPEEIAGIHTVRRMEGAEQAIAEALDESTEKLVLQISGYRETDFTEIVRDYARSNPDRVMETPLVEVRICPEQGDVRVVEMVFQYRTDRQELRSMREQVQPVFSSAALYVSGQAGEWVKFSQLHTFLTERFDYQLRSSVTPAYSLLCQGVGDSQAFAQVYTAMCSRIGLNARSVCGKRSGEEHWWNLVNIDGAWYHLDLLGEKQFMPLTDGQMADYEWDRSAYPAATGMAE